MRSKYLIVWDLLKLFWIIFIIRYKFFKNILSESCFRNKWCHRILNLIHIILSVLFFQIFNIESWPKFVFSSKSWSAFSFYSSFIICQSSLTNGILNYFLRTISELWDFSSSSGCLSCSWIPGFLVVVVGRGSQLFLNIRISRRRQGVYVKMSKLYYAI